MKQAIKRTMVTAGVLSSVAVAGIGGAGVVSAATTSSTDSDSLVSKIASKFNLDKDQVQKVFDENRAEHEAERQQEVEDKLTQAVTDGKITEAQKTKILAKIKEIQADMKADRDSMKDKTAEERKTAMEAKRTELEQWAKDNGIPTEYLHQFGGPGGRGGPGGPGGAPDDSQTDN